ncbi:hypothetical protein D3C86_1656920 [compost metagenome]
MVCCVSVSLRKRWPMSSKTVAMMAGSTARMGIRVVTRGEVRAVVATTSHARRTARRRTRRVRRTTTTASTSTTARINIRTIARGSPVQHRISTARFAHRRRPRSCRPLTCRSSPAPTPCARPSRRGAMTTRISTTRISRIATITISAGRAISVRRPMTITGTDARVDAVTAGGQVPGIAPDR